MSVASQDSFTDKEVFGESTDHAWCVGDKENLCQYSEFHTLRVPVLQSEHVESKLSDSDGRYDWRIQGWHRIRQGASLCVWGGEVSNEH